jgi:hypothetical protein
MDIVYRYLAAMYASRAVSKFIKESRVVVDKTGKSSAVTNVNPPLAQVTLHIDALEAAEQVAHHGPKGSVAIRNAALLVVRGDMRQIKSCVQVAADNDVTHAQEIIEGCGLYVSQRPVKAKPPLGARYGDAPGLVHLDAMAIKGQGSYQWQMSSDQKSWSDLPPTVNASTSVSGLTPATVYYFRFRTLTRAGFSDWSTAVSIIAH